MPTDPTTPASRPALPLRAEWMPDQHPAGDGGGWRIADAAGKTVLQFLGPDESAEWLVAQVTAAAELRGLLAECGRALGLAANWLERHGEWLTGEYGDEVSSGDLRLPERAAELAALAAKVAAAVGPAADDGCAWCKTAKGNTAGEWCEHCSDAPTCAVCGRGK